MTSRRARNIDTGNIPPPRALPKYQAVGMHIIMLAGEQLAGATEPGLDFVGDQQHVVPAA